MILLSENSEYKYFAIEVPKEAENIGKCWQDEGPAYWNKPCSKIQYFSENPKHPNYRTWEPKNKGVISLGDYYVFELLGVMGAGEEISEEVAKEIFKGGGFGTKGLVYSDLLKSRLADEGILVENNLIHPSKMNFDNFNPEEQGEVYNDHLRIWEEAESRLVKAVILKVKR